MMSKSYKDADDGNAENALVFTLKSEKVIMAFGYEHWSWDKNEKLQVPLVRDKRVAVPKSVWIGDGYNLTVELSYTIVPNLLAPKKMILKLDGADADFDLAGFPAAYELLRRCDDDPKAASAAPPPPAPGKAVPNAASTQSTRIAQAMTFPGDGDVPPQTVFAHTAPKILLAVEVRDSKPGDKLTTTWIAEKTSASPPNFQIAPIEIPLGESHLVSSSLSKPGAGWPPAQYRVDISHSGAYSNSASASPSRNRFAFGRRGRRPAVLRMTAGLAKYCDRSIGSSSSSVCCPTDHSFKERAFVRGRVSALE